MRYAWLTIKHKWFVFLAGLRVGGIPLWRLLTHDLSKFTPAELPHYNRHFFGDKSQPQAFARAWLHHQNVNPHHPEYWFTRTGHAIGQLGAQSGEWLPMPETYVREMIADWMGAGRAYTGSWDFGPWVTKNFPRMQMHPESRRTAARILATLGVIVAAD